MFINNRSNIFFVQGNDCLIDHELLRAFQKGDYSFFVLNSPTDDKIVHLAFKKEGVNNKFLDTYKMIIKHTGEFVLDYDDRYTIEDDEKKYCSSVTFLAYVIELEEQDKLDIRKTYKQLHSIADTDFDLTPDERRNKAIFRSQFISLFKKQTKKKKIAKVRKTIFGPYKLSYKFDEDDPENYFYIDDKIINVCISIDGQTKTAGEIKDILPFAQAVIQQKDYLNQSTLITYKKEWFSDLDISILSYLLVAIPEARKNNYMCQRKANRNCIELKNFFSFLWLYQKTDKAFMFNNKPTTINKEILFDECYIDEKGAFVPPKFADTTYYVDGNVYELKNDIFIIHQFDDTTLVNLIQQYNSLGDKYKQYVQDIATNIAIQTNKVSFKNVDNRVINLYIDINKDKELIFKTEIDLGDKKVSKAEYCNTSTLNSAIYSKFLYELEKVGGIEDGIISNEEEIYNFLTANLVGLKKTCNVFLSSSLNNINLRYFPKVNINMVSLDEQFININFESDELDENEIFNILNAYKEKRKFYLSKKLIILLDDNNNKMLEQLNNSLIDCGIQSKEDLNKKLPMYAYFSFSSINNETFKINRDKFIQEFIDKMQNYKSLSLNLPNTISKSIRPYQEQGIKWLKTLHDLKLSAILADDMGLGKTLQTLGLISQIKSNKPILIVCPKSVTFNWQKEILKWLPSHDSIVLTDSKLIRHEKLKDISNQSKNKIYITSYDSLRNDIDHYKNIDFALIVGDEAQFIKNMYAKKSLALKSLNSDFCLALTGTPIENSLTDLWSIFDWIMKGYLSNFNNFKDKYISNANENSSLTLQKKIGPFILRRLKENVLKDLPPKEIFIQNITMNEEESKIYNAYLADAKQKLKVLDKFSMLPILTHLRQLCVDASTVRENITNTPSKYTFVIETIESLSKTNHKFVIFSSFRKTLDNLKIELDKHNIKSYTIDGSTPAKNRNLLSNSFNTNDDVKVMLVSLKAGGTGLNLFGADYVIHLDPWWNFAVEDQATDRSHRIGQTRKVTVYKLVMHNSIEEKVIKLQDKKRELNKEYIKDNSLVDNSITMEDIKYLFE